MTHQKKSGSGKFFLTMRREKITFIKIFLTVLVLISFPTTIILTNSARNNHDIRSRAAQTAPSAGKIIFIPFSFTTDNENEHLFNFYEIAQIRNGFVPSYQSAAGPQFTAEVLNQTGLVLLTQKFSLPQYVAIDNIDTQTKKAKAEFKKVAGNTQGLSLPFTDGASYIRIINPKGETIKVISVQNASVNNNIINLKEIRGDKIEKNQSLLNPLPPHEVYAASGTFNIAIIGDNYGSDNLHFRNDVNDIAAGLVSVEPFKTYKANIVFYSQLSTTQICTYTTALNCNDTQALREASGIPYDKVYVLYNGSYGGYAYVGATLSYGTNATSMPKTTKQALFVHEMGGHLLGGLMDEYSYGTTGVSYAQNCSDSSACPSWSSISGLGCFSTCGYTNLYRATDNSSVMNTAMLNGVLSFDSFSSQVVGGKLVSFFNPVVPTNTIVPPSPTATPAPTNTPTPTPTIILQPPPTISSTLNQAGTRSAGEGTGEPQPSATPTVTISPTETATPTPTPQLNCSFPHFCAKGKYCANENVLTLSCSGSDLLCCRGQTILPNQNVTPTVAQEFDPLPTVPVTPTGVSENTPTPSSSLASPTNVSFNPSLSSTPTSQPTQIPEAGSNTPQIYNNPTQNPANQNQYTNNNLPSSPPPIPTIEITSLIYPTPTPYQVENIVFERVTPTPPPSIGVLDILAAPSRFVNNIVKNFFSLFSRNN